MEMYLIGVEYRKIESRNGGIITPATQICKAISIALRKDRHAIQYFPWRHIDNVKRLRQGLDNYKKDPVRYFNMTPPQNPTVPIIDEAEEEGEDDQYEEWEEDEAVGSDF